MHTYDELKRIVELAKKHDVFILSDEIHCDIMLNGTKFTSLNEFSHMYNKIMVFNSVSKAFGLAGLKTSNIILYATKKSIMNLENIYAANTLAVVIFSD